MEFQANQLPEYYPLNQNKMIQKQQSDTNNRYNYNLKENSTIIQSNRKGNKKLPKIPVSNVKIIPKPKSISHLNNKPHPKTVITSNKSPQVNNDDIIAKIIQKNKDIIEIKKEHHNSQQELIEIVDKLTQTGAIMHEKEQNEIRHVNKRKELQLAILSNASMKEKYDKYFNKENLLKGLDEISSEDCKAAALKKENNDLIKQINAFKAKYHTLQTKESDEGLIERKMAFFINEIRILKNQRNDYTIKLSTNKKIISNTIKEAKKIEDMYQKIQCDIKSNEAINQKISDWLKMINEDLTGSEEEILSRVDNGSCKILMEIDNIKKKNKSYSHSTLKNFSRNESTSPKSYQVSKITSIKLHKKGSKEQLYDNSLKTIRPYIHLSNSQPKLNKIPIKNKSNNEQDLEIYFDYDHTSNLDYKELLNKKDYYTDVNQKLEQSIQYVKERAEKKIKEMTYIYNITLPQLQDLQLNNNKLKEEILELEKALSSIENDSNMKRKEQSKESNSKTNLNHELYANTNILIDEIQQQSQSNQNDIFITGHNILQEMNLSKEKEGAEDDKKKLDLYIDTINTFNRNLKCKILYNFI